MRLEKIYKALGTNIMRYGLTHALRIPLPTPASRSQLEQSLRQVMTDPVASAIHPEAFGPPDTQCLNLGSLSLGTPESIEKAFYLLRSLKASFESKEEQKVINVSIRGIIENHTLHDCRRLYAPIIEPTGRLHALCQAIRETFLSAKLMVLDDVKNIDTFPMHTKIIHNCILRSTQRNTKPSIVPNLPVGGHTYRQASWDLRGLYSKFQDITWASEYPLERLTISETRPMNIVRGGVVIGRGFEELMSIPLPGIKDLTEDPYLQGVTYERPETIYV